MPKQKTLRSLILQPILKMFRRNQLHNATREEFAHWQRRSLWIRHLDCGSCSGCDLELTALENPIYDAQHLGIQFKSSPHHADVVAITGPFTRNVAEAARLTVGAMPVPRIVLIGDCAINKGIYQGSYALEEYPAEIENAIIAQVPGCPPTPQQILDVLSQIDILRSTEHSPATIALSEPSSASEQ